MKKLPVLSWFVCVLLAIAAITVMGTRVINVNRSQGDSGTALIGGTFSLTDTNGRTVTQADLKGHYSLVYFGFTHCPDICPTSLLTIENALDTLGPKGKAITPYFITLDPERDTQEELGKYVKHFGERFVGLVGTAEETKQVADAYKVYYSKVEQTGSAMGYSIDHSGFIYLMGPDGHYLAHFPHSISEQALAEALASHLD